MIAKNPLTNIDDSMVEYNISNPPKNISSPTMVFKGWLDKPKCNKPIPKSITPPKTCSLDASLIKSSTPGDIEIVTNPTNPAADIRKIISLEGYWIWF